MQLLSLTFTVYKRSKISKSIQQYFQKSASNQWNKNQEMAPPTKKVKVETKSEAKSEFVRLFEEERENTAKSILDFKFNKSRARILNGQAEVKPNSNGILYWMFRDQRVQDNWAFLFAQKLALKNKVPLHVCFCLLPKFLDANTRHYKFLVKGLQEIEAECNELNITFHLLYGDGGRQVPKFVSDHSMGAVICDLSPLRVPMEWVESLEQKVPADIPVIQVDAHNIVPLWVTSDKQEYAARTIRNKINSKLPEYLTEFPPLIKHPHKSELQGVAKPDWVDCWNHVDIDELAEVSWATPGYSGGIKQLEIFCVERLKHYSTKRNDPTLDGVSDLSPWFHFGNWRYFFYWFKKKKKSFKYLFIVQAKYHLKDAFCKRESTKSTKKASMHFAKKR